MTYLIEYTDTVVKKDTPKLPNNIKMAIKKAIDERLTTDPMTFGKPLRYSLKGHRRLRVSDYRILFRIEDESKIVLIIAIKHCKDVYDA